MITLIIIDDYYELSLLGTPLMNDVNIFVLLQSPQLLHPHLSFIHTLYQSLIDLILAYQYPYIEYPIYSIKLFCVIERLSFFIHPISISLHIINDINDK
jgi:hypothetical protein